MEIISYEIVPPAIMWAAVATALLVVEHIYALATPPFGLHVPFFFHLTFAGLYTWLGIEIWHGTGWAAIVLTVLLGTQSVGRIFVWRAEDRDNAATVKTILATGFAVTLMVLALLWLPVASRSYLVG